MITVEAINGVPVKQNGLNLPDNLNGAVLGMGQITFDFFYVLTEKLGKKNALAIMMSTITIALEAANRAEITEEAIAERLEHVEIQDVSGGPAQ